MKSKVTKKLVIAFSLLVFIFLLKWELNFVSKSFSDKVFRFSLISITTYFLIDLVSILVKKLVLPTVQSTPSRLDDALLPVAEGFAKILIILIAILTIFDNIGIRINSLIAGLGIGGVAIAIAAQSFFANFFGSITILADNIFEIDDYVQIILPGMVTEGRVKNVGIRSTKLFGKTGEEVIIPNKRFEDAYVINLGRRQKRLVDWVFKFPINTSVKVLEKAKKSINKVLQGVSKDLITEKSISISMKDANGESAKIYVTFELKTSDYFKTLEERDKIHLEILREFEKEKIFQG